MSGGVLSRFTVTLVVPVFPAWSVTLPEMLCPRPSVVTDTGDWQVTMSDALGVQTKFTVTFELFQPAAFGAGVALPVMVGAVFSMFSVTVPVAGFPARSVTVAVICCALPSVVTTCGGAH